MKNRSLFENQLKKLQYEVHKHRKIASFKELQMSRLKKEIRKFRGETQEPQPEKRSSRRIDVFLTGDFVVNDKHVPAIIENLSLKGMYMKLSPSSGFGDIPADQKHELTFKLPSGEILRHTCTVKWSCKALPHRVITCIGSEVLNPSQKYKEFINSIISPGENI